MDKVIFKNEERFVGYFLNRCGLKGYSLAGVFAKLEGGLCMPNIESDGVSGPTVGPELINWATAENQKRLAQAFITGWEIEEPRYRYRFRGLESANGNQYLSCEFTNPNRMFASALNKRIVQEFTESEFLKIIKKNQNGGWGRFMFIREEA